jgi:phospholipid transport system substrate-binding protein
MLAVILGTPLSAFSIEPLDALKTPVDQVLTLLQDPKYQNADQKEAQMEQIWEIIRKVFEFREIAKRTLARNWKKFTPQQKEAFTDQFAELLGNTYIGRIQGNYEDEKVVFEGQKK